MRKPSIHITLDKLYHILDEYIDDEAGIDIKDLVKFIGKKGKMSSLSHRLLLENTNKKTQKKIVNTLKYSSKDDANLFAKTLRMVRLQHKHKAQALIKESSKDWEFIRQASELAFSFCTDFNLSKKEGFTIYIEYLLKTMVRFNLRQINSKHEQVCQKYEAKVLIENDPNKKLTEEAYNRYINKVSDKTGMSPQYREKQPEKYQYFIQVGEICKERGINPNDYIDGNFESLSWASAIPSPEQLISENAIGRVIKWAYENSIKIGKSANKDRSKEFAKLFNKN